jgi:hypothetical protein
MFPGLVNVGCPRLPMIDPVGVGSNTFLGNQRRLKKVKVTTLLGELAMNAGE